MTLKEADALKVLLKKYRWTLEELVMDQKMQECNQLTSGAAKEMLSYLVRQFGSVRAVILEAKHLLRWQRGRAKTLNTESLVEFVKSKQ